MPSLLSINLLEDGHLPGPELYNQLAKAIRYARVEAGSMSINRGADGGLIFTLEETELKASFWARIEKDESGVNKIKVFGGQVITPDFEFEVDSKTFSVSNRKIWLNFSRTGGKIESGKSWPSTSVSDTFCIVPLAEYEKKKLTNRHLGDIWLGHVPYNLMHDYDPTVEQAFIHRKVSGGAPQEAWLDIVDCEEEVKA